MRSITLNDVDKLPENTNVYLVEKMSVTICNSYIDSSIHGDARDYPIYKFLKDSTGNLISDDMYPIAIIDTGDDSESSPIEDPNFKIFLTEREALTWFYKSLLEFQEDIQRFSRSINAFATNVKKTEYMTNHINSYPEDFI